jgi:diguanylate cyclase (GGDEF)-like protein
LITLAAAVLAALFLSAVVLIGTRVSEIVALDRNHDGIALILAVHDVEDAVGSIDLREPPAALQRDITHVGGLMDRVTAISTAHPDTATPGPGWQPARDAWRRARSAADVRILAHTTTQAAHDIYGRLAGLAFARGPHLPLTAQPGAAPAAVPGRPPFPDGVGALMVSILPLLDHRLNEARSLDVLEIVLTVAVVLAVMATVAFLTIQVMRSQARSSSSRAQLEYQALHDALTGLPNRRAFADAIADVVAGWTPVNDRTTWIFSIDLDYFKEVNDRYGHQTGDAFLIEAAKRLREATPPGDLVARVGGDEFAVLVHHHDPESDYPVEVAERICAAFDEPIAVEGVQHRLAASIGIVAVDSLHETVDSLVRDADIAMYRAKEQGGSRVVVFDDLLRQSIVHRAELAADLPGALRRAGEIGVVFQPIVELGTNRCYGFEALVRWRHPTHGPISAGLLIEVAQNARLIDDLGRHIVHEVCRHLAAWRDGGVPLEALALHFNISPMEAVHADTFGSISHALDQYNIPPHTLVVELTETASMDSVDAASLFLSLLHAIDVRICLDDFGTGFSSLQHLNDFHVDVIKVDRSFVVSAADDPKKLPIIAGIVALGQGLNADVIAEGIETAEQLAVVEQLNCRLVQGYLFSRPLSPEDAMAFALRNLPVSA